MPGKAQNQNGKFFTPLLPFKICSISRKMFEKKKHCHSHSLPWAATSRVFTLTRFAVFLLCCLHWQTVSHRVRDGRVRVWFISNLSPKHSILPVVVSQQRITEWRHTRTTRQIEGLLLMILSRKRLQLFGAQDPSHLSYGGTNLATSGMTLYGFMSLLCRFMSREWLEVPKR